MTPTMTTVLLAVLVPALDQPSIKVSAPTPDAVECVGQATTRTLSTTVQLRNGTTWIAPWRIMQWVPLRDGGHGMLAVLDRIVRVENGKRTVLPLQRPMAATVRADSPADAIRGAAEMWCGSVIRATGADRGPPVIIASSVIVGLGAFSG